LLRTAWTAPRAQQAVEKPPANPLFEQQE